MAIYVEVLGGAKPIPPEMLKTTVGRRDESPAHVHNGRDASPEIITSSVLPSSVRLVNFRYECTSFGDAITSGKMNATRMTRLLVVHSREPDCPFNLRHGLWRKTFRQRAKHSCVKLIAKDLDHFGPCAFFNGLNDHAIFENAVQSGFFRNPVQQSIIVFR